MAVSENQLVYARHAERGRTSPTRSCSSATTRRTASGKFGAANSNYVDDTAKDKDKYTVGHYLTQADPDDMAAFSRQQPAAPV